MRNRVGSAAALKALNRASMGPLSMLQSPPTGVSNELMIYTCLYVLRKAVVTDARFRLTFSGIFTTRVSFRSHSAYVSLVFGLGLWYEKFMIAAVWE